MRLPYPRLEADDAALIYLEHIGDFPAEDERVGIDLHFEFGRGSAALRVLHVFEPRREVIDDRDVADPLIDAIKWFAQNGYLRNRPN